MPKSTGSNRPGPSRKPRGKAPGNAQSTTAPNPVPKGPARKRRRKSGPGDRLKAVLAAGLIISIALALSILLLIIRPVKAPSGGPALPESSSGTEAGTPSGDLPETGAALPSKDQDPAPVSGLKPPAERPGLLYRGTLVFVIDDGGNNLGELEPFLALPGALTIAVLPGLPYSAEAARRVRAAGKELILHQPMEALGEENPGPGALYAGMSAAEIRDIIIHNIEEIGPVAGINNHQGSKITMDQEAMETILALCRERGIYFLDSRTTADTAAPGVAARLGMSIGERDVFLDNVRDTGAIRGYLQSGLERAALRGKAVMIGHAWSPETAQVLGELYPSLIAEGWTLSTLSVLLAGEVRR
ncbi:MAG: divergent polysaccharide deacetylase family protein [Treponema sp.]|jgi:polysaccharide deacetylase 2 family uncharacterized protein YibQ|nr:divergent polysaccharide deacetylase family protein [Treponema sp.]